jgi:hypothetical protein
MVDEKKYDLKKIAKAHGLTEDELMLKMQDDGDVTFAKWREGPLKIAPTPKPKTVEYKPTPKPTVKPTTAKPAPAQVVQPTPLVPEIKKPFYGGYFEDPNENYTYKPAPVAFNGRMFEDPNENVTKSKPWKAESKSEPLVNTTKIIQQAKTAWNRKVLPYFTDEQDTDKQSKTQFKPKVNTVATKTYDYILGEPIQDYSDAEQVYQHRSKYIDLTNPKIKTAYHNRGDKKGDNQPFKQVLFSNFDNNVFDDIHYLKRTNKLNPSEFYIGTSSEGKLIMGTGAEIANVNGAVSKFSIIKNVKGFKKDPKTGYKIKKSPDSAGHDTPFFDTDSGDVVTNILTSRSKSRFDEYGDVSGGSFIMMTPDKKVKVLASGSANELSNAIEKFKKDNKVEKLDIIKVDNGSYARTWNTNRNIVDQKFWDTYEGQNTRGGNAIYEYKNGGYVDSVLNANKNLEWVKRLYDENPQSIMLPGESNPSTHFMESSDNLVYPTIIQNGEGKLEYLGKGARDYAIKNKTFIEFPTENDAIQFGKNYKSGTGVLKGFQDGGVIEDNQGQWKYPGQITKINSNNITMKGVPYPVYGVSDVGDKQMMYPNGEYKFKGNSVTEYPILAQAGTTVKINKDNISNYNPYYVDVKGLNASESTKTNLTPTTKITPQEIKKIKESPTNVGNIKIKEAQEKAQRLKEAEEAYKKRKAGVSITPELLAQETQAIGDKISLQNIPGVGQYIPDMLDVTGGLGSMASNLGTLPLNLNRGNYGQATLSVAMPLGVGALAGIGNPNTGQFANNLINPFAGTGDLINKLGNKYLPNAHKLNPFAFKPDPEAFYRQVGKSAYDDAITKGKVFSNGQENMLERVPELNYIDEYNKSIALDKTGKFNLTKPSEAPFVQKGELFFPINRKPTGKGYKGTKYADAEYLLEGKLPNEAVLPRYQQKYFPTLEQSSNVGVIRPEFNELNNFNVYKRDWLKGYKQIEIPKKKDLTQK